MGIVNAGHIEVYEEIDEDLLERVEDVLLNRHQDATERLLDYCRKGQGRQKRKIRKRNKLAETWPVEERLSHALVKGNYRVY